MLIKLSGKPTKCNCLITCSYMICSPFFLSVDGRSRNLVLSQYIIKLLPPTSKSCVVCLLCNLQLSVFFWKGRGRDAVFLFASFGCFSSCFDDFHVPLRLERLIGSRSTYETAMRVSSLSS